MPLQATSGAASYDAFGGGAAAVPNYIEDVFSTQVYTGSGLSVDRTITNGIDLAGKGGIVWTKNRNAENAHVINSTPLGFSNYLVPNDTGGLGGSIVTMTANSDGYTMNDTNGSWNDSAGLFASWTFRKQPKFFDVVTYTGDGTTNRSIAHSLGSMPGFIAIKRTDSSGNWACAARYDDSVWYAYYEGTGTRFGFNSTDAGAIGSASAMATSTVFYPRLDGPNTNATAVTNVNGATYVAYLFAHNAGGFGLTGADNVITCGGYTGAGASTTVTLGYEPQWVMVRNTAGPFPWWIQDNMRGMTVTGDNGVLNANSSAVEAARGSHIVPTATGFTFTANEGDLNGAGSTYIYIAIRRGPMKVPTSGTSVFAPVAYTGTNVDNRLVNTGIVTDMTMARIRTATSAGGFYTADRLRGNAFLGTAVTTAEATDADSFMTPTLGYGNSFSAMNGFGVGNDATRQLNQSSTSQLAYAFKRTPSFFDEVCYTGTGSATTFTHNLGVAPELMIIRRRSTGDNWIVYSQPTGATLKLELNATDEARSASGFFNSTAPTSTVFTVETNTAVNGSGSTYVAYLFATCAGVSKVGSYTGNGSTQTIDCGFGASGARFVLIKRTDSTGDWYVYDTARGMTVLTDPYLLLNSTAAETATLGSVTTVSTGFAVNASILAAINTNAASYIFLAIA
jgi:hypothetical protein